MDCDFQVQTNVTQVYKERHNSNFLLLGLGSCCTLC